MRARCAALGPAVLGVIGALWLGAGPVLASASLPAAASSGPATLTVSTVPELAGVRVILDGVTHLTSSDGTVTIGTTAGRHRLDIRRPANPDADTRATFSRWLDGIALADRTVYLHQGANREEAGFALSYPIKVRFATKAGQPVQMSAISSVTMADSVGARFTFAPADPPSLVPANRIVRLQSGLYLQPIRYSVRVVLFGSSNVVYAGSQNFFVRPHAIWTIKVLLFSMRLEVRDALFGFPIGSAVRITMPGGVSRTVPLGPGHAVLLPDMPRSTYDLVAKGPGFGLSAPATLTKPLAAKLLLLSYVDIGAVVAFAILFVVGLPLVGGRFFRRKGRQPGRPAATAQMSPAGEAVAEVTGQEATDAVSEPAEPAEPGAAPLPDFGIERYASNPGTEPDADPAPAVAGPAAPERDEATEILPAIVLPTPGAAVGSDLDEAGR